MRCESAKWPTDVSILGTPGVLKIVQNAIFDIPILQAHGARVAGPLWDTMLAQQVCFPDAPGYSLEEIASYWLPMRRWKHEGNPSSRPRLAKTKEWKRDFKCAGCGRSSRTGFGVKDARTCTLCAELTIAGELDKWESQAAKYNLLDSAVLIPIYWHQRARLKATSQLALFEQMMKVLIEVLIPLQIEGLRIDPIARDRAANHYSRQADLAQRQWDRLVPGVPSHSARGIMELLYQVWGLPRQYKRTKEGRRVTADEEAIRELARKGQRKKELHCLLRLRGARKWHRTYTQIADRIYPRYGPGTKDSPGAPGTGSKRIAAIAATGRILAKGDKETGTPPIQQIPKRLRDLIVPDHPGWVLVGADWDSQELRLQAYMSGDPTLIELVESGDIHAYNAERFGCDRTRAKNAWYGGIAYGGSPGAVQSAMKAKGFFVPESEIRRFIQIARETYPRLFAYHHELRSFAAKNRYVVDAFGARRDFYDPSKAYNEILNTPIQSTAARMLWFVLPAVKRAAVSHGGSIKLLLHDFIGCQCPPDRAVGLATELRQIMEREWPEIAPGFRCPATPKIGPNWKAIS